MKVVFGILAALPLASVPVGASEAEKIILHCASLQSDEVRLACFDAVVALTGGGAQSSAGTAAADGIGISEQIFAEVAAQVTTTPVSDFHGFYAGGGAQTGFGPSLNLYNGPGSGVQPFEHSSPAWMVFAGHNWMHDDYMLGIEASATGDVFSESVYWTGFERFQETFAPTVSARAGIEVHEMLLFAKAGIGASFLREFDTRLPAGDDNYIFPAAALGAGMEVNFENIFLRLDGEVRHVMITPPPSSFTFDADDSLTTYRAGMGVGLRF